MWTLASIRIKIEKVKELIERLVTTPIDFITYLLTKSDTSEHSKILYCGVIMHARIGRMAKWVTRQSDFECILIAEKQRFTPQLSNKVFHKTLLYRNKWQLRAIIKKYANEQNVFHLFGPPYDCSYEVIQYLKSKQLKPKTFFDYQDLQITNFGLNPPFAYMKEDIKKEPYVLNNVDTIVSHSLEVQTAKKYYGNIKPRKLFFPLYVDNDVFKDKDSRSKDEIHLVYAGGVYSKFQNKAFFGGQQFHWLIEKLEKQKIHLHIYPTPTNRRSHLIDYIEYDKTLKYFHLHDTVSQANLTEELNQYDYGIIPFFNHTNDKLDDKRHYSTTLKLFNFIEAGIPVIMSKDTWFQNFMARRYHANVSLEYEEFDHLREIINAHDYHQSIRAIKEMRQELSLEAKIGDLIELYRS